MIDLYPFNGYEVVVLGLGEEGIACAKALQNSGANVWAWDDDQEKRNQAEAEGVTLKDLSDVDWREPVSMVIESTIGHRAGHMHPYVANAKEANCEVISDVELLARVQREAAYVGVVGHSGRALTTDVIAYVMKLCGREAETTGINQTPAIDLYPLELNGAYVLDMPSHKMDCTVSITFDVAVMVNFEKENFPNSKDADEELAAMSWVFNRQTKPKTAIVSIDDPTSLSVYEKLSKADDQAVLAISANTKVSGGVGVEGGWLIDDREGTALQAVNFANTTYFNTPNTQFAAVAAYACAVSIGLQSHAVMACLNSYEVSD